MRGGALPPALLCAALGFALAFAPRKAIAPSLLLLAIVAVTMSFAPIGEAWRELVFLACWACVILTAALVHLPRGPGRRLALGLGVGTGLACGAVVAVAGSRADLPQALPWALLAVPGKWLVERRLQIAVKVVASWLIAVAILAAALPITPTPGYDPDHLE